MLRNPVTDVLKWFSLWDRSKVSLYYIYAFGFIEIPKYLTPPCPFQIKEMVKLWVHLMTLQYLQKTPLTTLGKDARKNTAKQDYLM